MLALLFGIILLLRAREPKQEATLEELNDILSSEEFVYDNQLTRATINSTILAPTNLIAFFEGTFRTILLNTPDFLPVVYSQSAPYNLSPIVSALFMIIFGLPVGLIGSLAFAKVSDGLGKKNIKNRIYMIVISIKVLSSRIFCSFYFTTPKYDCYRR